MIKQLPTKVKTYNLIYLPIGIDFPYFSQTLQPTRTNNMTIDIIGAGIILANNAMQVYEKLGLRKLIEENRNQFIKLLDCYTG